MLPHERKGACPFYFELGGNVGREDDDDEDGAVASPEDAMQFVGDLIRRFERQRKQ